MYKQPELQAIEATTASGQKGKVEVAEPYI